MFGTDAVLPVEFAQTDDGVVIDEDGNGLTVTAALPDEVPPLHPVESVTAVTVYVLVDAGVTVRVAGLVLTPLCVKLVPPAPSSHVTVHGCVPVSAACTVVVCPEQIVELPVKLTVAVGGVHAEITLPFTAMSSKSSVQPVHGLAG